MRTLAEMIEQLKVHVRAAENLTWSTNDYDKALQEAARRMWRHIAQSPGAAVLRAFSADIAVPDGGVVSLPSDCLHVEKVEAKGLWHNGSDVYVAIPYDVPDWARPYPTRYYPPCPSRCHPRWTNDVQEGQIRLMGVRTGSYVRIVYYQEPVFPFEPTGTFRNPDGEATATYPNIPELCDSACEHFAAALMSGEELRDEAPIGYHGQQYSALLSTIYKGRAAVPQRRYVRHVSGRP